MPADSGDLSAKLDLYYAYRSRWVATYSLLRNLK
jgi:hypothetical protein